MSGTKKGGIQAAATNKMLHGADFYQKIGAMGGVRGRTGGFHANKALARIAGKLGGSVSRRNGQKRSKEETVKYRREFKKNYEELMRVHRRANG